MWLPTKNTPLSNLLLLGKGVAAGLEVHTDDCGLVYVSKGWGITSEGKTVALPHDYVFENYQPFTNPLKYPLFDGISAWELTNNNTMASLSPQNLKDLQQPFAKDKVVIAYTEGGGIQFLMVRQLDLIKKLGLERRFKYNLFSRSEDDDDIYSDAFSSDDEIPSDEVLFLTTRPILDLPEIKLYRFGYQPDKDCTPEGLDDVDFPCLAPISNPSNTPLDIIFKTYAAIIDEKLADLDRVLRTILIENCHAWLARNQSKESLISMLDELLGKWASYKKYVAALKKQSKTPPQYFIQYFYDWTRDLINAYHELRADLLELVNGSVFASDAFKHHLLLGTTSCDNDALFSALRTPYEQPPIFNGNAARLERARLYYQRQFRMITAFYLPNFTNEVQYLPYDKDELIAPQVVNDKVTVEPSERYLFEQLFKPIRITPSRPLGDPLSKQAIPFYYLLSPSETSLHRYWNYEHTKALTAENNLSYHANISTEDKEDSYATHLESVFPLYFTWDGTPFFRIEGHIGKTKAEVETQLKLLQRKLNLPFAIQFIDEKKLSGNNNNKPAFNAQLTGIEHLAGVKENWLFVIVHEDKTSDKALVIADFCLPCCKPIGNINPESCTASRSPTTDEQPLEAAINKVEERTIVAKPTKKTASKQRKNKQ